MIPDREMRGARATMTEPCYDELPQSELLGMPHSWGVHGPEDELGTLNRIDRAARQRGAAEVGEGRHYNLSLPMDIPSPPYTPTRRALQHHIFSSRRNHYDDYVDDFFPQGSSQWDGLRHVRARELGFYNGLELDLDDPTDRRLGVHRWADHGILTRGVLADVARFAREHGLPFDALENRPITAEVLEATLGWQEVTLQRGDVLLVRTGFAERYRQTSGKARAMLHERRSSAGLESSDDMARLLWDSGIAAVAADNSALENFPGTQGVQPLHRRLIPMLGFAIGEWFDLAALGQDCAAEGNWSFMFGSVPWNLPGGVGSPSNAFAIR
jgi:kynurenine formamidase